MPAEPEPVSQDTLMQRMLPVIRDEGGQYRKFQQVHARPAVEGEVIVSITADGEETRNVARPDDLVVRNLTDAREEYLLAKSTFDERYEKLEAVDATWTLCDPKGEIRAIEITERVLRDLGVERDFLIMAPWGSEQAAKKGDFFVSPLPQLDEVYRIGRPEFEQTYKPIQ